MAVSAPHTSIGRGGSAHVELWTVDLAQAATALLQLEAETPRLPPPGADAPVSTSATSSTQGAPALHRRASHVALRLVLERAGAPGARGMPFAIGPHGKPTLPGAPAFSLSHADGLALIALATSGPVGVDVEQAGRRLAMSHERAMRLRSAARDLLGSTPDAITLGPRATLQAWVRLEAFAKAEGGGIGRLLGRLGVIGRALDADAVTRAAAELRRSAPALAVHDLDLGPAALAAVALPAGLAVPPPRPLPATLVALRDFAH